MDSFKLLWISLGLIVWVLLSVSIRRYMTRFRMHWKYPFSYEKDVHKSDKIFSVINQNVISHQRLLSISYNLMIRRSYCMPCNEDALNC